MAQAPADLNKAAVLPLLAGALYTLIGPVIPTTVDELFVNLIALGTSLAMARGTAQDTLPPPIDVTLSAEAGRRPRPLTIPAGRAENFRVQSARPNDPRLNGTRTPADSL